MVHAQGDGVGLGNGPGRAWEIHVVGTGVAHAAARTKNIISSTAGGRQALPPGGEVLMFSDEDLS